MVGFEPQVSIRGVVDDAVRHAGCPAPEIRWIPTDQVDTKVAGVLIGASSVWRVPGGPFRSLNGALEVVRWAREARLPSLGTCAGFQHGVIQLPEAFLDEALPPTPSTDNATTVASSLMSCFAPLLARPWKSRRSIPNCLPFTGPHRKEALRDEAWVTASDSCG